MYEFTRNEIRDLLIAFAVLSISFAICNVGTDPFGIASILPIVMIGVGAGFLLHEIGHKFVSMKYGYITIIYEKIYLRFFLGVGSSSYIASNSSFKNSLSSTSSTSTISFAPS